jgi:hypothetical protein
MVRWSLYLQTIIFFGQEPRHRSVTFALGGGFVMIMYVEAAKTKRNIRMSELCVKTEHHWTQKNCPSLCNHTSQYQKQILRDD